MLKSVIASWLGPIAVVSGTTAMLMQLPTDPHLSANAPAYAFAIYALAKEVQRFREKRKSNGDPLEMKVELRAINDKLQRVILDNARVVQDVSGHEKWLDAIDKRYEAHTRDVWQHINENSRRLDVIEERVKNHIQGGRS